MKIVILLATALMVGCASTPEVIVPEVIKVPVAIPCKVLDPIPPELRYSPPYTSVFNAVRDLLGDQEVQAAYENELRIALKSCK